MPSFIAKQITDETIHRQKLQQRQTKVSTILKAGLLSPQMDRLILDDAMSNSVLELTLLWSNQTELKRDREGYRGRMGYCILC